MTQFISQRTLSFKSAAAIWLLKDFTLQYFTNRQKAEKKDIPRTMS